MTVHDAVNGCGCRNVSGTRFLVCRRRAVPLIPGTVLRIFVNDKTDGL